MCVAAYGADEFPAFFSRHSGCKAPCRVDTPSEAAALIKGALDLQLGAGLVLAVPIPKQHEAQGAVIQKAIEESLQEAEQNQVAGNEVSMAVAGNEVNLMISWTVDTLSKHVHAVSSSTV